LIEKTLINKFLIVILTLYLIGFLVPIIFIHRKGKDPHGMHKGYSVLARMSKITIILWFIYILLYLFIDELSGLIWPFSFLNIDFIIVIGMIMATIGIIIEFIGIQALGNNFRIEFPKEETELITRGIFRLMRNPITFALLLILIGIFLIIPNIIIFLIIIINIVAFDRKTRDEEIFLSKRFGKLYDNYKNEVPCRYFPFRIY